MQGDTIYFSVLAQAPGFMLLRTQDDCKFMLQMACHTQCTPSCETLREGRVSALSLTCACLENAASKVEAMVSHTASPACCNSSASARTSSRPAPVGSAAHVLLTLEHTQQSAGEHDPSLTLDGTAPRSC